MKSLYALLLYLFPKAYREEYGEELKSVFDLSLDDAMRAGRLEVARVVLHELISLPVAIIREHLRKPRYGLVAQSSVLEKDNYMKTIPKIEWEELGSWRATLVSLLPLWLFFFAYTNIYPSRSQIAHLDSTGSAICDRGHYIYREQTKASSPVLPDIDHGNTRRTHKSHPGIPAEKSEEG